MWNTTCSSSGHRPERNYIYIVGIHNDLNIYGTWKESVKLTVQLNNDGRKLHEEYVAKGEQIGFRQILTKNSSISSATSNVLNSTINPTNRNGLKAIHKGWTNGSWSYSDSSNLIPNEDLRIYGSWAERYRVLVYKYRDLSGNLQNELAFSLPNDKSRYSEFNVEAGAKIKLPLPPTTGIRNSQVGFSGNDPSVTGENAFFAGWSANDGSFSIQTAGTKVEINNNLKIYGVWNQAFWVKFYTHKDPNHGRLENLIMGPIKVPNGSGIGFNGLPFLSNLKNRDAGFKNSTNNFNAIFKGWAEDRLGYFWDASGGTGNQTSGDHVVTQDLNFYGLWAETFRVRFYSHKNNSGFLEDPLTGKEYYENIPIEKGSSISFPTVSINKKNEDVGFSSNGGYAVFKHWKEKGDSSIKWDSGELKVNKDLNLYAFWNRNHKLEFFPYRSASVGIKKTFVEDGKKIPDLGIKITNEQAGFFSEYGHKNYKDQEAEFIGWYKKESDVASEINLFDFNAEQVNKDIDLYARAFPRVVIDDGEGEKWIINPKPLTNEDLHLVSSSLNTNKDYKAYFDGWYKSFDGSNPGEPSFSDQYHFESSEAVTLYGKFTETTEQPKSGPDLKALLLERKAKPRNRWIAKANANPKIIDTSEMEGLTIENLFLRADFDDPAIGGWDLSKVTSVLKMFQGSTFNQPIGGWNLGNVNNMTSMFHNNYKFNQNMSKWSWKPACDLVIFVSTKGPQSMFRGNFLPSNKYPPFYGVGKKGLEEKGLCKPITNR